MYTDGITEAQPPGGELFGSRRFLDLVNEFHHLPVNDLCTTVKKKVIEYQQGVQADDITLVALKRSFEPDQEHSSQGTHVSLAG